MQISSNGSSRRLAENCCAAIIATLDWFIDGIKERTDSGGGNVRFYCSGCGHSFEQEENVSGPNVCLKCTKLIYRPLFHVPGWTIGSLLAMIVYVAISW